MSLIIAVYMIKISTHPALFKSKFLSEVLPEYDDDVYIYTDGSKQDKHMIVAILCMSVVCILLDFIVVVDFY